MTDIEKQNWYRFSRAVWRRYMGLPEAKIYRPKVRPRGNGETNKAAEVDDALDLAGSR